MSKEAGNTVADAMQRVLEAEHEAGERRAAARAKAEEILAQAREANRRIRFRTHERISRVQKAFAEATNAECGQLAVEAGEAAAAGADEIDDKRLDEAVDRLIDRLTGAKDEQSV